MREISRNSPTTIFLTGASGMLGQAVLEQMHDTRVIALVHRSYITAPNVIPLRGDITRVMFGLDPHEFRMLAEQVDYVVHVAAITSFSRPKEEITSANVTGTMHALDLASAAGAPICYVSTGFLPGVGGSQEANAYQLSKRDAEQLVRESGLPHIIVRPSLIVGDSKTGAIPVFQGLHLLVGLLLTGSLHVAPASPTSIVDFVPRDLVAAVIARLIKTNSVAGEYWLTTGEGAITLQTVVDICISQAPRLVGRVISQPRMVTMDMFERLIRPAFLDALPPPIRQSVDTAVQFATYLNLERPLPTSFPQLHAQLGLPPLPKPGLTLLRNLEYWAGANGYMRRDRIAAFQAKQEA